MSIPKIPLSVCLMIRARASTVAILQLRSFASQPVIWAQESIWRFHTIVVITITTIGTRLISAQLRRPNVESVSAPPTNHPYSNLELLDSRNLLSIYLIYLNTNIWSLKGNWPNITRQQIKFHSVNLFYKNITTFLCTNLTNIPHFAIPIRNTFATFKHLRLRLNLRS